MNIEDLYLKRLMSIPEISKKTGIALSTLRFRFSKLGILRSRGDAIRIAAKSGRLGSGGRGKTRILTDEWKKNISLARVAHADKYAAGVSIKPNGYVEYTRGIHKGRSVHVVLIEKQIGRRLFANEIVHHKDGDRQNNELNNLELMTRSAHTAHHAKINATKRKRDSYGKFK